MLKHKTAALMLGAAFAACAPRFAAAAEEKMTPGDLTASVLFGTDYTFRGISQTDSGPTIQGAVDWSYPVQKEIGVYLGVWGSNVDFDDGDNANMEIDLYGGVKGEARGFAWQVGGIYYYYPKSGPFDYDYYELALKLGYDFGFAAVTGSYDYSPDYFFATGSGHWLAADVSAPLPFMPIETALIGHLGHQWIEDNARFGAPDYLEWALGVQAKIEGFALTLSYIDTDIGGDECFAGSGLAKTCESRVVFSVSKTF